MPSGGLDTPYMVKLQSGKAITTLSEGDEAPSNEIKPVERLTDGWPWYG